MMSSTSVAIVTLPGKVLSLLHVYSFLIYEEGIECFLHAAQNAFFFIILQAKWKHYNRL